MKTTIYYIHTTPGIAAMFDKLSSEHLPNAIIKHIPDEDLIKTILEIGKLTPTIYRRVVRNVLNAAEAGAEIIQFTCSSISPIAEVAQKLVEVPVCKIDSPMAEHAVRTYKRIGVIATAKTTLEPSTTLLQDIAKRNNREVRVEPILCEGAYDAYLSGDTEKHDVLVRECLQTLMEKTDVIVLAQASISRVVETLNPKERSVPILSSPPYAMEGLKEMIGNSK